MHQEVDEVVLYGIGPICLYYIYFSCGIVTIWFFNLVGVFPSIFHFISFLLVSVHISLKIH